MVTMDRLDPSILFDPKSGRAWALLDPDALPLHLATACRPWLPDTRAARHDRGGDLLRRGRQSSAAAARPCLSLCRPPFFLHPFAAVLRFQSVRYPSRVDAPHAPTPPPAFLALLGPLDDTV